MDDFIRAVIVTLEKEWSKDIKDPRAVWVDKVNGGENGPLTSFWASRIEEYIRAAGGPWPRILDEREGPIKYRPDVDEWCGFFVGYGLANPEGHCMRLAPEISQMIMPSTYRLHAEARWAKTGYSKPAPVYPKDIQRGDVITVKTGRGKPYGDHIAMALGHVQNGMVVTIEGNAGGKKPTGPDGRQGVVYQKRHVGDVRCVYRFGPEHLVEK